MKLSYQGRPVNVFVVTENHYLYYGIDASLVGRGDYRVSMVSSEKTMNSAIIKNAQDTDIIFLVAEKNNFDFGFLKTICKCRAKVIYAKNDTNFPFGYMFDFIVITARFFLSDLLQAINSSQRKSRIVKFPNITKSERIILYYTIRGTSVNDMARYLSVSTKTVYQHQHNALAKVGVRKVSQLTEIPNKFIDYLYLKHQA